MVGWEAYWHLLDRDQEWGKHSAMHRCLPQQLSSSEHHSAKAERPWCSSLPALGVNALYIPPPLPELFPSLFNSSDGGLTTSKTSWSKMMSSSQNQSWQDI